MRKEDKPAPTNEKIGVTIHNVPSAIYMPASSVLIARNEKTHFRTIFFHALLSSLHVGTLQFLVLHRVDEKVQA